MTELYFSLWHMFQQATFSHCKRIKKIASTVAPFHPQKFSLSRAYQCLELSLYLNFKLKATKEFKDSGTWTQKLLQLFTAVKHILMKSCIKFYGKKHIHFHVVWTYSQQSIKLLSLTIPMNVLFLPTPSFIFILNRL